MTGFLLSSGYAQPQLGQTGFVFLRLPATAQQAALGEAYSALRVTDATALFTNPAAAALIPNISVTASYGEWIADMTHQTAAAAVRFGNYGVVGLSYIHMDYGDFDNTVLTDDPNYEGYMDAGKFDMGANVIGLTYAYQMTDRFSFGGTARYIKESTGTFQHADTDITTGDASNVLMEIGTFYNTGFGSLRLATIAQNFGFTSEYFGNSFQPPIVYRMGAAYDFFDAPGSPVKLTTTMEFVHPTDNEERIHVGGECSISNVFILRGGYKFAYDEASWSAGGGLRFPIGQFNGGLDFSYSDFGVFGNISRATLVASF
jgi:hypothetical protein